MKQLLKEIKKLQNSEVKNAIEFRTSSFKQLGKKKADDLFSELCFCILTANFNAERGIEIQNKLCKNFLNSSEKQLASQLKLLGHRFPNARANYIVNSRTHKTSLKKLQEKLSEQEMRSWLVNNVKGLGMKEASHFMRNIGYDNVAIIDFHILDLLEKYKLTTKPKTITPAKYLEIESVLKDIANKVGMTLSELDLYLWYMETGKILK